MGDPLGEAPLAVPGLRQLRLQAAHHHPAQLLLRRFHPAGEAVVVEQFQEGGEGLQEAVVRGRGEEEPVLAVGSQRADRPRALRIDGVLTDAGGCAGVHLIDDEQIEGARIFGHLGKNLAQHPHRPLPLQPVHRDDQPWIVPPRIGVETARAPQFPQQSTIDDAEVQAELVPHLVLPLEGQSRGADDQHGAGPVAEHELLHDQPRLDRLAQADVIGDQQIRTGHGKCAYDRGELVLLDLHAGPEGGLEGGLVGGGDRSPADRVQEGVKTGGIVDPVGRRRQLVLVVDNRPLLQLPDDPQLLVAGVVLDRDKDHQM
ncbi:hypothetical protein SALBM135S_01172 [Streptomyces alboniger]